MGERTKHTFQFPAEKITEAAAAEAEYHDMRAQYWTEEQVAAATRVMEEASVKLVRQQVTDGERMEIVVDYGDPTSYRRMQEAFAKIGRHKAAAEQYRVEARVYGSQEKRVYDLDAEDVRYFHLGGEPRED